jgi:hypothetical protein
MLRSKKVVGVFVRFRAPFLTSLQVTVWGHSLKKRDRRQTGHAADSPGQRVEVVFTQDWQVAVSCAKAPRWSMRWWWT